MSLLEIWSNLNDMDNIIIWRVAARRLTFWLLFLCARWLGWTSTRSETAVVTRMCLSGLSRSESRISKIFLQVFRVFAFSGRFGRWEGFGLKISSKDLIVWSNVCRSIITIIITTPAIDINTACGRTAHKPTLLYTDDPRPPPPRILAGLLEFHTWTTCGACAPPEAAAATVTGGARDRCRLGRRWRPGPWLLSPYNTRVPYNII